MSEPASPPAPRPKGQYCPFCRGVRFVTVSRAATKPEVRFRYVRCSTCRARMKLQERFVKVTRPPEVVTPPAMVPDPSPDSGPTALVGGE